MSEPQLEKVGLRKGDWIIWDDGSPPTPVPEDLRRKPAHPACQSEADQ